MYSWSLLVETALAVGCDSLDKNIIKSLILDLFDFDLEDFKTKVDGYNIIQDILDPMGEKPYLIQDRLEDVIVF